MPQHSYAAPSLDERGNADLQPAVLTAEGAQPTALMIEDLRQTEPELRSRGYICDRITHHELTSTAGVEHTGKLMKGDYNMSWVSMPSDWHARVPHQKHSSHWQRILSWIHKAVALHMLVVVFGPRGFAWKVPNVWDTVEQCKLYTVRVRLCHFGDK